MGDGPAKYSPGPVDRRYWRSALSSLARHVRDKQFAREWLSAGLRADLAPRAPAQEVFDAFPDVVEQVVSMGDVVYRPFNMDPTERFCVGALARMLRPRRIFEFGTYDGATTLLLARAAPEALVTTFDLPPDAVEQTGGVVAEQLGMVGGAGSKFRGVPESDRIVQLYGDSREFDATPYRSSMGMVVVDGSHDYDCVRADSENALRMLAPGGVIVWDDYAPRWAGVVRAVDELAERNRITVVHLVPLELAVYDARRTFP